MADDNTPRAPLRAPPWWRQWGVIGTLAFIAVAAVCTIAYWSTSADPAASPDAGTTPAAAITSPTSTPTIAATPTEPAPTWEQCQPFAHDFHDAVRRSDLAVAERNAEISRSALTLEHLWRPAVVDHAEAKLGKRFAEGSAAIQDANSAVGASLQGMPHACYDYAAQWDDVAASMTSPAFEDCGERSDIAREAIPEHTRWAYAQEAIAVLDKLEDPSSRVDVDVAYAVLGELLYADHVQMQEAARASLITRCDAVEWETAAEELSALEP